MAEWLSTREAARRLGVGVARVNRFARDGRLPSTGGGHGRARRYRAADVEAFAAIPRRPGGSHGGGAPRANFNRLTTARRSHQLHPVRRLLPPASRAVFDAAVVAAVGRAGGARAAERRRNRLRAVGRVVLETVRAWALPAQTVAGQHLNLVRALRPWLDGSAPGGRERVSR